MLSIFNLLSFFLLGQHLKVTIDSHSTGVFRSQVRRSCCISIFVLCLTVFLFGPYSGAIRGEGSVIIMGDRGGRPSSFPKAHDVEPRKIQGSLSTSRQRTVAKRSYRRAARRACLHGFTWYRGRLHSAQALGSRMQPTIDQSVPKNLAPTQSQCRRRMTCFSWNCSGMTMADWDWIQNWLEHQHIDVLLFQETHWKFTSEWVQSRYMTIHSGFSSRQGGLLCLISKRLGTPHSVSWQEIQPGHLVHIRIHGPHTCTDIINIYQYPYVPKHAEVREDLWMTLHKLLHSLPKRNTLVLAGDLNCTADQRCNAIGYPTYLHQHQRHRGTQHQDKDRWIQLLKDNDLQALNTWTVDSGATYYFGEQHSRIDFICCRREHADCTARNVIYMTDFTLNPTTGAFHVPLITSIRRDWYPAGDGPQRGWSRQQRLQLHRHCLQKDEVFALFQQHVQHSFQHISQDEPSIDNLNSAFLHFTTPSTTTSPLHPYKLNKGPCARFQEHTKALRSVTATTLKGLFQAWFLVHQRCQARRDMAATAKAARKQRLREIFDNASKAEHAQDHFMLFQHVRSMAPKQPLKRIMLRNAQGQLLGPQDSADWIQAWYTDIYSDSTHTRPSSSFTWPFSCSELASELATLPTFKALSPEYAPAPFWRFGSEMIADYLTPWISQKTQEATVPTAWQKGSLALLVKPGRGGHHPADLRPIILLEPTGKATMGLVAKAIHTEIGHVLRSLPQFAYMENRGTHEAIHRLVLHCRSVRTQFQSLSMPIHRHQQGLPTPPIFGGLTLSLDLSRAFDTVPREQLFVNLSDMGISPDVLSLLRSIYDNTNLSFDHRGEHREFRTFRGIRQGCRCAPCLWAVYLSSILLQAQHVLTPEFVLYCITAYADDICIHQEFTTEKGFTDLLQAIGHFLDLLETAQLEINVKKTTAMLRMRGAALSKLQRRHIQRTAQGTFLKIPRKHGNVTLIQLVSSCRYLGITLSYFNYEKATMNLRIKHSWQTSLQLHRWLFTTQGMTTRQKVKLWYQCVFACLTYGILSTGVTEQTLIKLHQFSMRQLRRILHEPVYIARTTHRDFLQAHNLDDPLWRLHQLCVTAAQRSDARRSTLANDDIQRLHTQIDYTQALHLIEATHWKLHHAAPEATSQPRLYQCPECTCTFAHLHMLRRHCTLKHGRRSGRIPADDHIQQTVPTCHKCQQSFSTWSSLEYHLNYVCNMPAQDIDQLEHRLRVQELLHFARANQIADLGIKLVC